jgi:hypothetical protein
MLALQIRPVTNSASNTAVRTNRVQILQGKPLPIFHNFRAKKDLELPGAKVRS